MGNQLNSGQIDDAFTTKGFKGWYRPHLSFVNQQKRKVHINIVCAMENFFKSKPIDQVLDEERKTIMKKREADHLHNRALMTRLIDICLYLVKGCSAFHDHNEENDSSNQGNFKELVKLLSKYDSLLNMHLETGQKNAQYLSNCIQNDIITRTSGLRWTKPAI